jgi:hypothetical protein
MSLLARLLACALALGLAASALGGELADPTDPEPIEAVTAALREQTGAEPDAAAVVDRLHRIDPEVVRRDFKAAGFALEAESPMLAHADDDHAKQVFDPDIRGRTDQFVFRFRRPGP